MTLLSAHFISCAGRISTAASLMPHQFVHHVDNAMLWLCNFCCHHVMSCLFNNPPASRHTIFESNALQDMTLHFTLTKPLRLAADRCRLRKEALTMRWAKEVHYLQRRVLYKWRFAVADARRLYHAGHQIQRRATLCSLWGAFSAWRADAQRRKFCQRAVTKALLR